MRITSKGQVTIPQAIREQAGLLPGCEVEFRIEDGVVRLAPAKPEKGLSRGERIVAHLRGRGSLGLSTDQIMALTRGED
jgi:AbrB family looped-hinge helix DNA binding protein